MRLSDYISRAGSFGRMDDCCGTCGSHLYDHSDFGGDRYTCRCRASPYFEEFTEYDDYCDEYHERGTARPVPDFED